MPVREPAPRAPMIHLDAVTKEFPSEGGSVTAVRAVSLEVARGETLVLIGTSGCGKTTTLRLINRLEEPTAGRVFVGGEDTASGDPIALRRRIGYVVQQGGLFPHLDVRANVTLLARLEGHDESARNAIARAAMERARLPESLASRYPRELSGGQRQRVGVARALALDPEVLLMDEPFGALDPITRAELQDEMEALLAGGEKTVVAVTHDLDEAFRLGTRVGVMAGGELVQLATPEELVRSPNCDFVADFVARQRRG